MHLQKSSDEAVKVKNGNEPEKKFKWAECWLKKYLSDFSIKQFWILAVLSLFFVAFKDAFIELYDEYIIAKIASKFHASNTFKILLAILLIYSLYKVYSNFKKHSFPKVNSLMMFSLMIFIYLLVFRSNPLYLFADFVKPGINIYSADIIILILIINLMSFKTYKKELSKKTSLFTLYEDNQSNNDEWSREGFAKHIKEYIENTTTTESIAVGIEGSWGAGKSDFLKRLKIKLEENQTDNRIIEFTPWQINGAKTAIEDFYDQLSKVTSEFDTSILPVINRYSKKIFQNAKEVHFKFIDTFIDDISTDLPLKEQFDLINKTIKDSGKRLIVFVDDLDRLMGDEIIEIFKLIRGSANFSNTFFIVAYDHSYIVETIKKTNKYHNEGTYIKKIFQLVINLPAIPQFKISSKAREMLLLKEYSEAESEEIKYCLQKYAYNSEDPLSTILPFESKTGLFEDFVCDMRDLKRFCNSFKISFAILKAEVCVEDLFLLELLKYKNFEVYKIVRDGKINEFNKDLLSNNFEIDTEKLKEYLKAEKISDSEKVLNCLSALFSSEKKNARRIARVHNFYLYFSYQIFNSISFSEFNEVYLNGSWEAFRSKIQEWLSRGFGTELNYIFGTAIQTATSPILYKAMKAVYCMEHRDGNLQGIISQSIFNSKEDSFEKYFSKDVVAAQKFYVDLLADREIPVIQRIDITFNFLSTVIKDGEQPYYIFDKVKWIEIQNQIIDEYFQLKEVYSHETFQILLKSVDRLENNSWIPRRDTCKLVKDLVVSNKDNFNSYIKFFMQPYFSDSVNFNYQHPYLFENIDEFKTYIEQYQSRLVYPEIVDFIIGNIEDYFANKKNSIEVNTEQLRIFNEHFRKIGFMKDG